LEYEWSGQSACERRLRDDKNDDTPPHGLASNQSGTADFRSHKARVVVPHNPCGFQVMPEAARKCLRDSRYGVFGLISCKCDDGVLALRGHLPSFYLKQHAQKAVAGVEGVTQVVNEIEVD
jgi:hypothetical protein